MRAGEYAAAITSKKKKPTDSHIYLNSYPLHDLWANPQFFYRGGGCGGFVYRGDKQQFTFLAHLGWKLKWAWLIIFLLSASLRIALTFHILYAILLVSMLVSILILTKNKKDRNYGRKCNLKKNVDFNSWKYLEAIAAVWSLNSVHNICLRFYILAIWHKTVNLGNKYSRNIRNLQYWNI